VRRVAKRWRLAVGLRPPAHSLVCTLLVLFTKVACADAPLGYLRGHGPRAVTSLTWGVLLISIFVVAAVTGILAAGIWRGRRSFSRPPLPGTAPVERPPGGVRAIYAGVLVSALVLFSVTIWTVVTLADVGPLPSKPAMTIEVTGHQWWWEVRYLSDDPSIVLKTANEIHIPAGEVVAFRLQSADVIHSFWVPKLSGKTDLIPGQINETWLKADVPGVFRGQCTEYCGLQHAHMGLLLIASRRDEFDAWKKHQLESAPAPGSADAGLAVFSQKCAICHAVRGTRAGGIIGPDLTHLMSRTTIAAVTLPNRIGFLSGWIADPQSIKPGTQMPAVRLSGPELNAVRTYLGTLN
jgi:cytochrome c oxidase subunit II